MATCNRSDGRRADDCFLTGGDTTSGQRPFGFYMFAAAFSSVLTFALSIAILQYLDWRWVFRLPVLLLLGAGIAYYLLCARQA